MTGYGKRSKRRYGTRAKRSTPWIMNVEIQMHAVTDFGARKKLRKTLDSLGNTIDYEITQTRKRVTKQTKKLLKYVYELERIAVDQGYDVEKLGYDSELQKTIDKLKV